MLPHNVEEDWLSFSSLRLLPLGMEFLLRLFVGLPAPRVQLWVRLHFEVVASIADLLLLTLTLPFKQWVCKTQTSLDSVTARPLQFVCLLRVITTTVTAQ